MGLQAAAYNTFCTLWRELTPYITVMKPMTDLCWVCQQNSTAIMRAANTPDEAESEVNQCTECLNLMYNDFTDCEACGGSLTVCNKGKELSEVPSGQGAAGDQDILLGQGTCYTASTLPFASFKFCH